MKKLKRIIVGIDIFAKSNNVLKRALMLAKEHKAELFIVHAVETPWFSVPSYFGDDKVTVDVKGITKKIEKMLKTLNKKEKVSYAIFVKEGNADDIILYKSKLLKADMIVIGSHTKSKKRRTTLGTTAHKVAHKSHLPVLIVKNSVKKPYKNIIAPTDFEVQSKQSIIFTKKIFPTAKIKILHVYETFHDTGPYKINNITLVQYNKTAKTYAENNLKFFSKKLAIKKGEVVDGKKDTLETLTTYIKKDNYDLVIVGSRGTSGFQALLGSVASFILREVPNDVLVYVPID